MDDKYDIVIIGAGLGGLLSAVILAKEGKKVCVIERDKQIGGCLQTFSFEKKVFDSCVHYIGGLGEGHTLNKIFRYAGIMDKLQLKQFDPDAFDKIAFGDDKVTYPQAQGSANFIEQLSNYFPAEKSALEEYIKQINFVGDHFPLYRLRSGNGREKEVVSNWGLTDTLNKITQNKKLQAVLTANNLLYAGVKDKSPFFLHALVVGSYIYSSHKVLPGSSEIAKYLWRELQQNGGIILRNTEVARLVMNNGTLSHAVTKNGDPISGNHFIANIHPQLLLDIIDDGAIRPAYKKRIESMEQTTSTFMSNIVLKPRSTPMEYSNLYWNATEDVWHAVAYRPGDWPANYILFYTEDSNNKGYAESISVLSYMHFEEVSKWSHTLNRAGEEHHRCDEYEHFKRQKEQLLLSKVFERLPALKDNIVASKTATPLTYRDYTGTLKGSLYGIQKDMNNFGAGTLSCRTKIPNLFLTGQNVNLHGVLGVSITAVATCAELLGMDYLLEKIHNQA